MKTIKAFLLMTAVLLMACSNSNVDSLPVVKTGEYTLYVQTLTATCNGYVETDGGGAVIERGICYMRGQGTPAVSNTCVSAGSGKGSYSATLTNLQKGETYSYRAYATNSKGTAYGDVAAFKVDENSIVDPVNPGDNPGDNPSDNPGDNNQNINEALKPIVGTYVMNCETYKLWEAWDAEESHTWQGIRIYPNFVYGETGVTVEGLYEGDAKYAACGRYDASTKKLTLYEGTNSGKTFSYSYEGSSYAVTAKFQPLGYSVCAECGVWSGSSLPLSETEQVTFELTAANTLTLGLLPNSNEYQIYKYKYMTDVDESLYSTLCVHKVVLKRLTGAY